MTDRSDPDLLRALAVDDRSALTELLPTSLGMAATARPAPGAGRNGVHDGNHVLELPLDGVAGAVIARAKPRRSMAKLVMPGSLGGDGSGAR